MLVLNFREREVWKCNLEEITNPEDDIPGMGGKRVCLIIMSNRYDVTVVPFTTKVDKYKVSDDLVFHLEDGYTSVPCFHSIKTISKKDIIPTEFYGVMHTKEYNQIIQTISDIATGKIILPYSPISNRFSTEAIRNKFSVGVPVSDPSMYERPMKVDQQAIEEISSMSIIDYYDIEAITSRNKKFVDDYFVNLHVGFCALNIAGYKIVNSIREYKRSKLRWGGMGKICGFFDMDSLNIYINRDIFKENLEKYLDICPIKDWITFMQSLSDANISTARFKTGPKVATKRFAEYYINTTFTPFSIKEIKLKARAAHQNRKFINDLFETEPSIIVTKDD